MSTLHISCILAVLLIGLGIATDIPYVFHEDFSDVLNCTTDQLAQISSTSLELVGVPPMSTLPDKEVLVISETGDSEARGTVSKATWELGELKRVFDERVEPQNDYVNHKALVLAAKYPGERTIDQICAIYQYVKDGDASTKGWSYVSDVRGVDIYRYANDTLRVGEAVGCSGAGDCDDFAIIMSSLIESIGGTTKVVLAYNRSADIEGHAYTLVYLGNFKDDQVWEIIKWLQLRYGTDKIFTFIDPETKGVWLNLDWTTDHPGGPFCQADTCVNLSIREEFSKTALRAIIDSKKIEAENWNDEGLAFYKLGKYDEAINAWYKALKLNPEDATAWVNIGCTLGKQGEHSEANKAFNNAIEINPEFAGAWSNKGYALDNLGKYYEALQAYDKAVGLDPDDALAWDNMAHTLIDLGRYSEALNAVDEAIEANPKIAKAWSRRAYVLEQEGRYDEALEACGISLEVDPDYADAWNEKGWILYLLGRYNESLLSADKAVELDPERAEYWDTKGAALAGLGRNIEAIECYDKAIELDNDRGIIWYHKGDSLYALGRDAEAEDAFFIAKQNGYEDL
jgi:tetratricopeptide (TPR) repeat protein